MHKSGCKEQRDCNVFNYYIFHWSTKLLPQKLGPGGTTIDWIYNNFAKLRWLLVHIWLFL